MKKLDPRHDQKRWAQIQPRPLATMGQLKTGARKILGCTAKTLTEIFEQLAMTWEEFGRICQRWCSPVWCVDSDDLDKWVPGSSREDWEVFADLLMSRGDERGPWIADALGRREPIAAIALYYCAPYGTVALMVMTQFSWERKSLLPGAEISIVGP